jgi:AcrR family transcriptional regulator
MSVLKATTALLARVAVRDLTVEAIARKSGVGKATIYRWWPNKTAVVIDAFMVTLLPRTPLGSNGRGLQGLARHVKSVVALYRGKFGRVVAEIIAEARFDPPALKYFRDVFLEERRVLAREVIEQAKRSGEVRPDLDTELIIDLLYSPIYFRLLLGHAPLDDRFARNLPKLVFAALNPH